MPLDELDELLPRVRRRRSQRAGGIDVQLLGIGRNGHIGFNEPFSAAQQPHAAGARSTRSRAATRPAISSAKRTCRTQAITMGLGTILDARKIVLIALGEHKAGIIREAAEGPSPTACRPASCASIADAALLLDCGRRRQAHRPSPRPGCWATSSGPTPLIKRAVLWLCEQDGQGAAQARRRRLPQAQPAPAAAASRPGAEAWPTACSAG